MQMTRFAKPALIAVAVSAAFAFGYQARMPGVTEAVAAAPATSPSAAARTQLPDFSELVESNGKSVVNIAIVRSAAQVPAQMQGIPPELLRRFGIPGMPGQGQPGPQARGVGSGFIISADGLILTNAHVVEDAAELVVRLADKREFKGKVLGADKLTDVAVVKIDAKDLPALRLGSSDKLRVGEWVAAIGSPFGLESSVTAGIVSAKSRNLPDDRLVPFIQTDVAVNPGNSGGPLFNMAGEVVGINSQIFSTSGGYMGLSFAIPIDLAVKIKDQLVKDGKVSRGRLGVGIQGMDQALAETFGLQSPQGALVSKVESGQAAAKAGLKEGDVILEFNGKPLKDSAELPALVAESRPGSEVKLKIWRDRAEKTLDLKIGTAEAEAATQVAAGKEPAPQGKLGVAVRPLQPQEAQQLGLEGGMVVQESSGPAAKAGIRSGDVIVSVNGKPVKSIEELRKQVAEAKGTAAVLVERQGGRLFVPVPLG